MQLGGLCVLCGKDMTNSDYIGFSDTSRASIQMTHSANGPTVSLEEAQRIERETAERLVRSAQALTYRGPRPDDRTCDCGPDGRRVDRRGRGLGGEAPGEEWEQRAARATSPSDTDDEECNPNWEALKDVKKFRLGPESFGAPYEAKGKGKSIEQDGCMYCIKPRPGWENFLQGVAAKYEMHVYTTGTRAYAVKPIFVVFLIYNEGWPNTEKSTTALPL
ncbi:hypothetical protein IW261DRAFT_1084559 [Armillaria novae-zelandiae]|uniref:protein-serine/threonine phosphatase n=1 Tax=Armillaria novae-zelandiae TaxID=153914 RepID=A0AA39PDZ1_9AGAR|nr:hypothetical protein IW261DRAFT_1084559 [Armillaria novae-zelandiae]